MGKRWRLGVSLAVERRWRWGFRWWLKGGGVSESLVEAGDGGELVVVAMVSRWLT